MMFELTGSKQEQAMTLHCRIMSSAQMAQESLYDMCCALKEMRDSKLYQELGYGNFENYCEQQVGLKQRQAYNYIAIAEKLDDDFLQSSAQHIKQIGVKKLYLLTTLTEEQRDEIVQNTDLENTTVRELEAEIKQLKQAAQEKDRLIANQGEEIRVLESKPMETVTPTPEPGVAELRNVLKRKDLEYSEKLAELENESVTREQEIHKQHRQELDALKSEHEQNLSRIKSEYEQQLASSSQESPEDVQDTFEDVYEVLDKALLMAVGFLEKHRKHDFQRELFGRIKTTLDTISGIGCREHAS